MKTLKNHKRHAAPPKAGSAGSIGQVRALGNKPTCFLTVGKAHFSAMPDAERKTGYPAGFTIDKGHRHPYLTATT